MNHLIITPNFIISNISKLDWFSHAIDKLFKDIDKFSKTQFGFQYRLHEDHEHRFRNLLRECETSEYFEILCTYVKNEKNSYSASMFSIDNVLHYFYDYCNA